MPWEIDENDERYVAEEEDRTWFVHRKMSEAEYQEFINLTSTVKLGSKKKGKNEERAEMNLMLGTSRMFLLAKLGVTWNLVDEFGKEVVFNENNIKRLPPEIVKAWIDDIYEANPILKGEDEEDEGEKVLTKEGDLLPKG